MAMSKDDFKNAFREVISSEFAHIPSDEDSIDYTLSERFNKKMNKLIKAQRKSYYFLINTAAKRVAVIFVAFLTLFTASMSVKAIREPVVEFIVEIYEHFTSYFFAGDTVKKIEKEYALNKLPVGFKEVDKIKSEISITTVYENDMGDIIEFIQTITDDTAANFDTQNATKTTVIINDNKVDIYTNKHLATALWTEGQYMLNLTYYGEYDIEIITSIISNIDIQ